ncbi:MAG TPA: riboflavin synthase [Bacteroidota bacterium]|nr:riboflavin synthase [Bacteroidota bacterium]
MFTGLIESVGTIESARRRSGSVVFVVKAPGITRGLKVGDSVAVEGVCLTVTKRTKSGFETRAVEETLTKTTLGKLHRGDRVNLERALLPTARLGGHFVLGHVDCVGTVVRVEKRGSSWMFWFRVPQRFRHLLIPVGSVAINGVSLTVASLRQKEFGVSIIPHTMEKTTFRFLQVGDHVNVEFDVLGKYVERLLALKKK